MALDKKKRVPAIVARHDALVGESFGRLTLLEWAGRDARGESHFLCDCCCGNSSTASLGNIRSGHTKSCGCLGEESRVKHGRCGTPVYLSWRSMIQRCTNPKSPNYYLYGGRGITVCSRWLTSIENFIEDLGDRPEGTSLDRIDNDGNYEPPNCRWATAKEQQQNTRKTKLNPESVRHIRNSEESPSALASMFGVDQVTVSNVRTRHTWRNIV